MNNGAKYIGNLISDSNICERDTFTFSDGYKFKDVGLYSDFNTDLLINNYDSLTTYKSGSISESNTFGSLVKDKEVLGRKVAGVTLMVGSNGGAVQNGASAADNVIVLTTRWNDYNLQLSAGNFIGINLSADKVYYETQGKGCTTSYSILSAHQDGDDLQDIIDSIKYLNFIRKDFVGDWSDKAGANYENFYALGTIDSLFKGGLDAFFDTDSTSNSGGEITVNSSNMYNFITVENWQTN
jgi:hypothetical protein